MNSRRYLKTLAGAAILMLAVTISSCTRPQQTDTLQGRPTEATGPETGADREFERAQTMNDLIALRDRIDARINNVEHHLEMVEMPDGRREELQDYRQQLEVHRDRVEEEINTVEAAGPGTWEAIDRRAASTIHEVEIWFNRQGQHVESWFDDDLPPPDPDTPPGPGTQPMDEGTGTHTPEGTGTGTQGTGTTP